MYPDMSHMLNDANLDCNKIHKIIQYLDPKAYGILIRMTKYVVHP